MERIFWQFMIGIAITVGTLFAAPKAMIIYDASGSMWGQIDGVNKVVIARDALRSVVQKWNPQIPLGLTAYGHRVKGDCNDIEMLIPIGRVNKQQMIDTVNAIMPKGMTPIAKSLRMVADKLRQNEDQTTIILISDGRESCDQDPCATAKQLKAEGINFVAHVVGFNVDARTDRQLACIAHATGGEYFSAKNAAALNNAIKTIAKKVEKPKPKPKAATETILELLAYYAADRDKTSVPDMQWEVTQGAKTLYSGKNPHLRIPAKVGKVHIKATYDRTSEMQQVEGDIALKPQKNNTIVIPLKSGTVTIDAVEEEGGPGVKATTRIFPIVDGQPDLDNSIASCETAPTTPCTIVLPIGSFLITGVYNGMRTRQQFSIRNKQNQPVHLTFSQTGQIETSASETDGGKWVDAHHNVYEDDEGKPGEHICSPYSYKKEKGKCRLPVGKYIVKSSYNEFKKLTPIEIKPGETLKFHVVFGSTGQIETSASETEGGKWVNAHHNVYEDDEGKPGEHICSPYSYKKEKGKCRLPVGKYIVKSSYNEFKKLTPIEIKPGETPKFHVVFGSTGQIETSASETEGGKWVDAHHIIYEDDESKPGKHICSPYSYKKEKGKCRLPVGKYIVKSSYKDFQKLTPVEVKPGETTKVHVVFAPLHFTAKGIHPCTQVHFELISPQGQVIAEDDAPAKKGVDFMLEADHAFIEASAGGAHARQQVTPAHKGAVILDLGQSEQTEGISGIWKTSEGSATIRQNGKQVRGEYDQDGGVIIGQMTYPQRMEGYWIENRSDYKCATPKEGRYYWGRVIWNFDNDMCSFKGKWSYCDEAPRRSWKGHFLRPLPPEATHQELIKADKPSTQTLQTKTPPSGMTLSAPENPQAQLEELDKAAEAIVQGAAKAVNDHKEDIQKVGELLNALGGLFGNQPQKSPPNQPATKQPAQPTPQSGDDDLELFSK